MMMDWDSNEEEQQQEDTKLNNHNNKNNNNNNNDNSKNNEEGSGNNNQNQNQNQNQSNGNSSNVMYVKVMTDEQMETLRKQIAVYADICDQLVLLHKSLSAHQDLSSSAPGGRLGSLYCDPLVASGGHKITARQRWTPTPVQLQILERIFDQGNGTPSKQKIKEITSDLSQHGQISETNVYNWFQNRRARSKRKQLVASSNNNGAESEVETEVDSLNENKTKPEIDTYHSQRSTLTQRSDDLCFQGPEISSELHFLGDDHLAGKMGTSGNYSLYAQPEDYGMTG